MSIVNDITSINARLIELETEAKRRFQSKPLEFNELTNAGEFIWRVVQSGQLLNAALPEDDRITEYDLKTEVAVSAYRSWLNEQTTTDLAKYARRKLSVIRADIQYPNAGMENLKISFARLRLMNLL
jgi:hypothetical protein